MVLVRFHMEPFPFKLGLKLEVKTLRAPKFNDEISIHIRRIIADCMKTAIFN